MVQTGGRSRETDRGYDTEGLNMYNRFNRFFKYNPDTGALTHKIDHGRAKAGEPVGSTVKGYIQTKLNGTYYYAHVIGYVLMTGEFPKGEIDHKNGIRNDNRWDNLKDGTRSCNQQNTKLRVDNTSGYKGVTFDKAKNKWAASAFNNGKRVYLGMFDSKEDARDSRVKWEDENWTHNHRKEGR